MPIGQILIITFNYAIFDASALGIGWYIVFWVITAHAIRAILLARATATSLKKEEAVD